MNGFYVFVGLLLSLSKIRLALDLIVRLTYLLRGFKAVSFFFIFKAQAISSRTLKTNQILHHKYKHTLFLCTIQIREGRKINPPERIKTIFLLISIIFFPFRSTSKEDEINFFYHSNLISLLLLFFFQNRYLIGLI